MRVPDDVSVVGFDGIEFAEFVTPTLTTIQQPRREIGRMGARTLITAMNEQSKPRSVLLDAPLIVRDSTAPPPAQLRARGRSQTRRARDKLVLAAGGERLGRDHPASSISFVRRQNTSWNLPMLPVPNSASAHDGDAFGKIGDIRERAATLRFRRDLSNPFALVTDAGL